MVKRSLFHKHAVTFSAKPLRKCSQCDGLFREFTVSVRRNDRTRHSIQSRFVPTRTGRSVCARKSIDNDCDQHRFEFVDKLDFRSSSPYTYTHSCPTVRRNLQVIAIVTTNRRASVLSVVSD